MKRPDDSDTWAVLLYAAGRNELDPEIYRCVRALTAGELPDNVSLAIQIARPPAHALALLRPMTPARQDDGWTGARRYLISPTRERHSLELGGADMSDPRTLAEFLIWGMDNLPARRLMVIVSGHGAGFLGLLSDYSAARRTMMSLKGFARALRDAARQARRLIDVLVLDACHMQMVEVWHQLIHGPERMVDYLITPLGRLRLEGMALPVLLAGLGNRAGDRGLSRLAGAVAALNEKSGEYDAIMLSRADRRLTGELKALLGRCCLTAAADSPPSPPADDTLAIIDYLATLAPPLRRAGRRLLAGLCLQPPVSRIPAGRGLGPSVLAPGSVSYLRYQPHYDALLFAQHNPWTRYIAGTAYPAGLTVPLSATLAAMRSQNPGMTGEQARDNIARLGWLGSGPTVDAAILAAGQQEEPSAVPTRGLLL